MACLAATTRPSVDWTPQSVACIECGAALMRRLHHPVTHERLQFYVCDRQCKAAHQRRQRPVTNDWLVQKYVVERLNCTQISKLVNRNPKRVWEWIKDAGIEPRRSIEWLPLLSQR